MKNLATVFLKVEPNSKNDVRDKLQDRGLKFAETEGLWDFVVEIQDTNLNCDVPQEYALWQVADKICSMSGVISYNVDMTPQEFNERKWEYFL